MADYNSAYTGAQIDANLAKAATAVQPAGLATVATSGAYNDLTGKPTLGTAAATASTAYATAAQGTLAASAVQPGANANVLGSGSATDNFVLTANGAGGVAWEAASGGGGTPGGTDTQVQFNDGGAFGGDSGFTFDKTNNTLGLGGGTITASDPIIDMAQTWNNAAVAFTALKANVTDTASAAGSLLMDLQVGGVSKFSVNKAGTITVPSTSGYSNSGILFSGVGPKLYANGNIFVVNNSSYGMFGCDFGATQARINGGVAFGFSSGDVTTSLDVLLARDAANTLAQRNGVNAQAFNLYNTYTDASNYERGFMRFVSNVLQIGSEKLGTGTARALAFQTDGTTRLTIAANGTSTFDGVVSTLRVIGTQFVGVGGSGTSPSVWIATPTSGVLKLTDSADNNFNRVQFGGTTSSFPAIKRSTTSLQARLADDSAFTNIQGKLTTDTAYTAGAPTATGYIVLFDSAGTAYKVPAEAL